MARCGCGGGGGGSCNCVVQGSALISVTGVGTPAAPYVVAFTGSIGGDTAVTVGDTATLNLSIAGDGSLGNPYVITGVVPDGTVVPSTEATQDIIGGALGNGLVYNDGGGLISAKLSADAANTLIFGTDGGLWGAGASTATFLDKSTAQAGITSAKTWDLPDDDTTAIRINTQVVVTSGGSTDTFAIYWGGTVKTGWHNEWGGLRVFTPNPATLGYSDQAIKLFSRQDVDTFQIIRANTSNIGYRLRDVGLDLVQQFGGAGPWQALTNYVNGYVPYALLVEYEPRARLAVGGDYVELRGRIDTDATPTAAEAIATLPVGLRPLRQVRVDCTGRSSQTLVRLDISTAGVITNQTGGTYQIISLDGIRFYAGAN